MGNITYIRMRHGFLYLVAFIEEALTIDVPEIANSDQGGHFTSEGYTR